MALKKIRINKDEPVSLQEAFMGIAIAPRFIRGSVESILLDGRAVDFTAHYNEKAPITEEKTDEGTWYHQTRLTATAVGYYGEEVKLSVRYSAFKDRTYRQLRHDRSLVLLTVDNCDELQYPIGEVYALLSAEFSDL